MDGIGGLVYLSLVSPNFLRYQGLLAGDDSVEMDVNVLYMIARNTILPAVRDYANDQWRIDVMSGHITPREYNCWWWSKKWVRRPRPALSLPEPRRGPIP